MSKEDKLNKCIKLLQSNSEYSTKIIAELLDLDMKHNNGEILSGLEHDLWCLNIMILNDENEE